MVSLINFQEAKYVSQYKPRFRLNANYSLNKNVS